MRILIIGSNWFASVLLDLCISNGFDVAAVVAPNLNDKLAINGFENDIAVHCFECIDAVCLELKPDVILAAHCHAFISSFARSNAKHGCFAYHPSLLPRHRGRDAIEWAIRFGDKITGGTIYQMDEGADTGAIAFQDWCFIRLNDTANDLWRRELAPTGLRLFERLLYMLKGGVNVPLKAQDSALATWEPRITKSKLG